MIVANTSALTHSSNRAPDGRTDGFHVARRWFRYALAAADQEEKP
jgi:hypothetical protein